MNRLIKNLMIVTALFAFADAALASRQAWRGDEYGGL
jgi:hypothetical protein